MENTFENSHLTANDIFLMFKETDKKFQETDKKFQETDKLLKEYARILTEKQAETDRLIKENARTLTEKQVETDRLLKDLTEKQAETAKQIKDNNKQLGGMCNSNGDAATEFFYNSLKYKQHNLFGEHFDDIYKEVVRETKKGFEDEYDVLGINCRAVCIVEVKFKADTNDVEKILRKVITFRENFPEHSNKILYLAAASMSFHKRTEKAFIDNGIAIIKQVGDTVAIHDGHLKRF